jgi:hypothetical protein
MQQVPMWQSEVWGGIGRAQMQPSATQHSTQRQKYITGRAAVRKLELTSKAQLPEWPLIHMTATPAQYASLRQ